MLGLQKYQRVPRYFSLKNILAQEGSQLHNWQKMRYVLLYPLQVAKKRKQKGKDTSKVYLSGNHSRLTQISTNPEFTYNDSQNYGAPYAFSDLSGLFLGGFS